MAAAIMTEGRWNIPDYLPVEVKDVVQRIIIKPGTDKIVWRHSQFSLKAAWSVCRYTGSTQKWSAIIWRYSRPRVAMGVCIILHNRNLSLVNLQKCGIILTSICHNCWRSMDTNDHLFYNCTYAQAVWQEIFSLIQMELPVCESLMEVVDWFCLQTSNKSVKTKILSAIFTTTVWKIWNVRNVVLHDGCQDQAPYVAKTIVWEVLTYLTRSLEDFILVF
ncbi:uncharacterized protein LOC132269414 [Cornus florida]|uniref:uncharacterized protein LOC132269414 n=1 Tax=Cornus florida TaxID=4283 RepID=UPI0028987D54|nr:uncharacterized protein LOC132269414 [Cornus florida]